MLSYLFRVASEHKEYDVLGSGVGEAVLCVRPWEWVAQHRLCFFWGGRGRLVGTSLGTGVAKCLGH